MRTLRTASTLLVVLVLAACASGDPTGPSASPDQPSYRDGASGTVTSPDRPSFGGSMIGSGY